MIDYFEVDSKGLTLRGLLHKRNDCFENVILIVHGYFSSNKIGPHRLYFELAELLSEIGFPVLRIDLSGMGESDGNISEIEFWDHVSDIYSSVKAIQSSCIWSKKVHLIGHCVGCCNVLSQCTENDDFIDTITLVCPFIPSKESFSRLLGEQSYEELNLQGYTRRKGLYCKKSFIDAGFSLKDTTLLRLAQKHNLFAYIASKDELSTLDDSLMWLSEYRIPNTIIESADHNFINPDGRQDFYKMIGSRFAEMRRL